MIVLKKGYSFKLCTECIHIERNIPFFILYLPFISIRTEFLDKHNNSASLKTADVHENATY